MEGLTSFPKLERALDSQVRALNRPGNKGDQHPAIREWLRWREYEPMIWATEGDMPLEVSLGFSYLVRAYGRDQLNAVSAQHEAALVGMNPELPT